MQSVLLIVQIVTCVGLIVAVLLQTTESEGLSGTIGGRRETFLKGKKGVEALVDKVTTGFAVGFILSSLLTALLH